MKRIFYRFAKLLANNRYPSNNSNRNVSAQIATHPVTAWFIFEGLENGLIFVKTNGHFSSRGLFPEFLMGLFIPTAIVWQACRRHPQIREIHGAKLEEEIFRHSEILHSLFYSSGNIITKEPFLGFTMLALAEIFLYFICLRFLFGSIVSLQFLIANAGRLVFYVLPILLITGVAVYEAYTRHFRKACVIRSHPN